MTYANTYFNTRDNHHDRDTLAHPLTEEEMENKTNTISEKDEEKRQT